MSGGEVSGASNGGDMVIVAIDGSSNSDEAFEWYVGHLHRPGNQVLIVHGSEIPSMPTRDSWDTQVAEENKRRGALQERYQARFKELNISGKFISDFEKPGPFLVENAKKHNAAYIVMGTRGMGKLRRTIMGSVSDFVVHHAECPVLVCRSKK